jgi:spermidine synthase
MGNFMNRNRLYYLLFFVSGFAGLIYESVWARYLKLFLGHSSYGQLLTLCIFMGGLALGSFVAGKYSHKIRNPLRAFAYAEILIATSGVLFHPLYTFLVGNFYGWDFLQNAPQWQMESVKILLSIFMTMPWAFLMGLTFPWMAAGLMRKDGDWGQKAVSGLYFTNAFGAAIGILFASFFLIEWCGVDGALRVAAGMDLLIGLTVLLLNRDQSKASPPPAPLRVKSWKGAIFWLGIAWLTGFTSFVYEVIWIRMLSLMLGSSSHSFDLMIAAFILGLSFGSLYIHKKMQKEGDWDRLLANAQIYMGAAALMSIVLYPIYFHLMNYMNDILQDTEGGYFFWNICRFFLCILWMVPTSFFAGQTLPLISCRLQRNMGGEYSTGLVYGSNTMGAILGAAIGGLFLMPNFGLKGGIWIASLLDMAQTIAIFWFFMRGQTFSFKWILALVLVLIVPAIEMDNEMITSGLFRGKREFHINEKMSIVHGRTATISFHESDVHKYIKTNGKADASISKNKEMALDGDELTQAATAFFPMLSFEKPYRAAVIGFGSGMSVHYLLSDSLVTHIDMIEIEPQMVELAKGFLPDNSRAFDDKRVSMYFEDARTYFHSRRIKYDMILSVPSNPWVSGVSSLFSDEFYSSIKPFISENGYLVQWIQLYEFRSDILMTILHTLANNFDCVQFFISPGHGDLILMAGKNCAEPNALRGELGENLKLEFERIQRSPQDFGMNQYLSSSKYLLPFLKEFPLNSDFDPQIDFHSEKARYMKKSVYFFDGFYDGWFSYNHIFDDSLTPDIRPMADYYSRGDTNYIDFKLERHEFDEHLIRNFKGYWAHSPKPRRDLLKEARWQRFIDLGNDLSLKKIESGLEVSDELKLGLELLFLASLWEKDYHKANILAWEMYDSFVLRTMEIDMLRAMFIAAYLAGDYKFAHMVGVGIRWGEYVDSTELKWLNFLLNRK